MSAPRSQWERDAKRIDKLTTGYRERLQRQSASIERLAQANMVYADATTEIIESKSVRDARKIAQQAQERVAEILAVPKEEQADG